MPTDLQDREALAMKALMGRGMSRKDAAALVGNMVQESGLNPTITSDKGAHIGLMQWNAARQRQFEKDFGYQIGSRKTPARQQYLDELVFAQRELHTTQKETARKLAAARSLWAKTRAIDRYDERPGERDHSFGRRLLYAQAAYESGAPYVDDRRGNIHHVVTAHAQSAAANLAAARRAHRAPRT